MNNGIALSSSVSNLFAALSKFQGDLQPVLKKNHGHRHKYADINAVLDAIRPLLKEHELSISQHPHADEHGNQCLMTILGHSSGEWMSSSMKIIHDPQDIQSFGGSITYQRRYALVSILGIEQEDDDGNYRKPQVTKISPSQVNDLMKRLHQFEEKDRMLQLIMNATKVNDINQLTDKQYQWVIAKFF